MVLICVFFVLFFFKQKTAYEMRISDWSSDVCSSDLLAVVMDDMDFFPDLSVVEHLDLVARAHRVEDPDALVDEVLREVGLVPQPSQLPEIGRAACRDRVGQYV